ARVEEVPAAVAEADAGAHVARARPDAAAGGAISETLGAVLGGNHAHAAVAVVAREAVRGAAARRAHRGNAYAAESHRLDAKGREGALVADLEVVVADLVGQAVGVCAAESAAVGEQRARVEARVDGLARLQRLGARAR